MVKEGGHLDHLGPLKYQIHVWAMWGSQTARAVGRAETNTARMIFRLVLSEKMSNRPIKVVLCASNNSFEVGPHPKKCVLGQKNHQKACFSDGV